MADKHYAWVGEEPQIDENSLEIASVVDIVIVGAGLAGVTAARSAAEAGATVAVIEKLLNRRAEVKTLQL
jgi:NADPH-dependent 2,4-dienoyl-CoA reductase/sulfur reductase-like enzyme